MTRAYKDVVNAEEYKTSTRKNTRPKRVPVYLEPDFSEGNWLRFGPDGGDWWLGNGPQYK